MISYAISIIPKLRSLSAYYLYYSDKAYIQHKLGNCSHHYILYPHIDTDGNLYYKGIIFINNDIGINIIQNTIGKNIGKVQLIKFRTFTDKLAWLMSCRTIGILKPIIYKNTSIHKAGDVVKQFEENLKVLNHEFKIDDYY